YIIKEMVFVESGAELYIEAGTVVKAELGSGNAAKGLVISRGGKLFAEGTPEKPIIFTSVDDQLNGNLTYEDRGKWGGIVMLGYAPTNNGNNTEFRNIEGINEIVGAEDNRARYGGNDPMDNSGVLRYVSIRHTGIAVGDQAGNEIQGLTLGGVGAGTTIEYVESYASDDDGFEFFGGTVNTKYLVSAFNSDDGFDWDEGFSGKGQFWFVLQGEDKAGRMAEMDGAIGNENTSPFASPIIMNATYLGDGKDNVGTVDGDGEEGLIFRDNTAAFYYNSIFGDFKGQTGRGITIEDIDNAGSKPFDSRQRFEQDSIRLENNIWFGFAAGNTFTTISNQDFVQPYLANAAKGNQLVDPMLRGISRIDDGGLDPRPDTESPAWGAAKQFGNTANDPFFDKVGYIGAFGATNWLKGWTALSQNGYLGALADEFLTTDIEQLDSERPDAITLSQNYPNPFNPSTQISFTLNTTSNVSVAVYDVTGRLVATLATNKAYSVGTHTLQFNAANLASGIYMYQLKTDATVITKKMTLIK
ncbi:T9SS type A sorting domain-containing protein, partial [bacterium]